MWKIPVAQVLPLPTPPIPDYQSPDLRVWGRGQRWGPLRLVPSLPRGLFSVENRSMYYVYSGLLRTFSDLRFLEL